MNGEHKAWVLSIIAACILITAIVSINSWRNNEIMLSEERQKKLIIETEERMIREGKINPVVLNCIRERNWNQISVYEICSTVLKNHKMTRSEAEKVIEGLEK